MQKDDPNSDNSNTTIYALVGIGGTLICIAIIIGLIIFMKQKNKEKEGADVGTGNLTFSF